MHRIAQAFGIEGNLSHANDLSRCVDAVGPTVTPIKTPEISNSASIWFANECAEVGINSSIDPG